jgi:hypothetical protein
MENGVIWHKKEDEFNQKDSHYFWREANKKEVRELRKMLK